MPLTRAMKSAQLWNGPASRACSIRAVLLGPKPRKPSSWASVASLSSSAWLAPHASSAAPQSRRRIAERVVDAWACDIGRVVRLSGFTAGQPVHIAADAGLHIRKLVVAAGGAQGAQVGLGIALVFAAQGIGERHVFHQPLLGDVI